jgi:hypothetical protein
MGKRLLINGVIIVSAVIAGVTVSLRPWRLYRQENELAQTRVKVMRGAEADRDRMLKSEARHRSSIGREEDARGANYLGPGEVASATTKS